jgi:small subunit ribosomal protein S16
MCEGLYFKTGENRGSLVQSEIGQILTLKLKAYRLAKVGGQLVQRFCLGYNWQINAFGDEIFIAFGYVYLDNPLHWLQLDDTPRSQATPPWFVPLLLSSVNSVKIMVCLTPAKSDRKEPLSVLMIRLARTGARKQPQYRVVVIEKERARNGRPVEIVGTYNPRSTPVSVELKRERIDYWVSKGAKMSDRVSRIRSLPAATSPAPVAPLP